MDPLLRTQAENLLDQLPRSVELPAGTGKTELVAALTWVASNRGLRGLVLTHTHSGLDALRRRLNKFGTPRSSFQLSTIAGWSYSLARQYPDIGQIQTGGVFQPKYADNYTEAAARITLSPAILDSYAASFDYVVVDEYQDCTHIQHHLISAISMRLSKVCVLGDRMQAIFDFGDSPLVDWSTDVENNWPRWEPDTYPWRWHGHNVPLGKWLLSARQVLLDGKPLDLSQVNLKGLYWIKRDAKDFRGQQLSAAARNTSSSDGISTLIAGQVHEMAAPARKLSGQYVIMEEIEGAVMSKFLGELNLDSGPESAVALVRFVKQCFVGASGLDQALMNKLVKGQSISGLKRIGISSTMASLDRILIDCTFESIASAMSVIEKEVSLKCYRREAWQESKKAVSLAIVDQEGTMPVVLLQGIRDQSRHTGRNPRGRKIITTPLRYKGLECDDAIVLNANLLSSERHLYVALTRARSNLTIISDSTLVWPARV